MIDDFVLHLHVVVLLSHIDAFSSGGGSLVPMNSVECLTRVTVDCVSACEKPTTS